MVLIKEPVVAVIVVFECLLLLLFINLRSVCAHGHAHRIHPSTNDTPRLKKKYFPSFNFRVRRGGEGGGGNSKKLKKKKKPTNSSIAVRARGGIRRIYKKII